MVNISIYMSTLSTVEPHPKSCTSGTRKSLNSLIKMFTIVRNAAKDRSLRKVIFSPCSANSRFISMKSCWPAGNSSSGTMASMGHSGVQSAQSMH